MAIPYRRFETTCRVPCSRTKNPKRKTVTLLAKFVGVERFSVAWCQLIEFVASSLPWAILPRGCAEVLHLPLSLSYLFSCFSVLHFFLQFFDFIYVVSFTSWPCTW